MIKKLASFAQKNALFFHCRSKIRDATYPIGTRKISRAVLWGTNNSWVESEVWIGNLTLRKSTCVSPVLHNANPREGNKDVSGRGYVSSHHFLLFYLCQPKPQAFETQGKVLKRNFHLTYRIVFIPVALKSKFLKPWTANPKLEVSIWDRN